MSEFRNFDPVGRDVRRTVQNREALEKERLSQRKEGFLRYDRSQNPLAPAQEAAGYLPDHRRFAVDAAAEEKASRDAEVARKREADQNLRQARVEREHDRWGRIEQSSQIEQDKLAKLAGTSKRNESSVGYDLMTLTPSGSDKGQHVLQLEREAMGRAEVRKSALAAQDSKAGYNVLTGQPVARPGVSSTRPW